MHLSGNPIEIFLCFWAGVLVSFTPCVYPLVPITAGLIGANSSGSRLKGLSLSLTYVSGIAITYSFLGLFAVFTGTLFGKISVSPITHLIVGAIMVIFGISMLGAFNISLPILIKLPAAKKQNYFSVLLLGLASGLIVSPCLSPALGSILLYVSTSRNLFYGAALLLSFAYGMGFTLILAGISSGLLVNLPKPGKWMVYVKKGCAIFLIASGLYFIAGGIKGLGIFRTPNAEAALIEARDNSPGPAPDFKLRGLKQKEFKLSDYQNKKPLVLMFWTTWCPYCRDELISLNAFYPQLQKEGFEAFAINVEEPPYKVEYFAEKYAFALNVLLDEDGDTALAYGIFGVPTFFLVNKKGFIVYRGNYFPLNKYQQLVAE
ncbi:MAG: redoxin domain-containing protein [Candidatus Omnitrophota bacterium]